MAGGADSRAQAALALLAVRGGRSLDQALLAADRGVSERDRGLLRELCYGSLRWYPELEALVNGRLQRPLKARDAVLRELLIVGAYQLLHLAMPPHAALSSTVDACRELQRPWARGLVNAVLRSLQREGLELRTALPEHARAAHPEWLYHVLRQAWPEESAELLAANNQRPPMCLRVNRRQGSRADYLEALRTGGQQAEPCLLAADGIRLREPCPVEALPGFDSGRVSVQDEASQLAAPLLTLQPGMRVLDACCAPGGKTGHLLECEPGLRLLAIDRVERRLQRVRENLARLDLYAELRAADIAAPETWWDGEPFAAILLDAPCSGTGVIRRHPDIKLLRRGRDIPALAARQGQMLDALWPCLAQGGELLYTTCSVLPEENEVVVAAFLARTADAEQLPITGDWGVSRPAGRQLLTAPGGPDGFYFAHLRRRGN